VEPLKKTNTVSTIAAVVLFLAMAVYLGVYLVQSTRETLVTSPAVKATVTDTAEISGIAVREETVISSERAYVFVNAEDGSFISSGSVVASAMDSEAALERAGRKRERENEISHISTLLSGISSSDDLTERDAAIRSAILSLSAAVSADKLSDLDGACVELTSLIFSDGDTAVSEADLEALESELSSIEGSTYTDSEDILAPEAGLFSTILDGRESLTPDMLANISPADVKQMISDKGSTPAGAIGKLITSYRWYFAGVMSADDAENLSEGDYVTVSLGRYYGGEVSMRVEQISTASGGERAVVLSSLNALADTLAMREADAEIICSEYTGLRVPAKAIHVDDDGNSFVYVVTAGLVDVKYVETVCQSGDYYIVDIGSAADSLREGNEIIVSGKNVQAGMIVE
jgi:hypothetical protein